MTSTEPRTVYAVTEGEYSDFGYMAIFEDRSDAEDARAAGLGDDIHEIRYYPKGAALPTRVSYWKAWATIMPDGTYPNKAAEPRVWDQPTVQWTCEDVPDLRRPLVRQHVDYRGVVSIEVNALTQEAALKACSDRATKVRAEIVEGHHD